MVLEDVICLGTCDWLHRQVCAFMNGWGFNPSNLMESKNMVCFIAAKAMYPMSGYHPKQTVAATDKVLQMHSWESAGLGMVGTYPLISSLDPTLQSQWFGTQTLYPDDMWHSEAPKWLWCYCRSKGARLVIVSGLSPRTPSTKPWQRHDVTGTPSCPIWFVCADHVLGPWWLSCSCMSRCGVVVGLLVFNWGICLMWWHDISWPPNLAWLSFRILSVYWARRTLLMQMQTEFDETVCLLQNWGWPWSWGHQPRTKKCSMLEIPDDVFNDEDRWYCLEVGDKNGSGRDWFLHPVTPTMNVWLPKFQGSEDPTWWLVYWLWSLSKCFGSK